MTCALLRRRAAALAAGLIASGCSASKPSQSSIASRSPNIVFMLVDDMRWDEIRATLYNTMLATRLPDGDGDYPYYSDYGAGAEKKYYQRKWPCCSGTLVQGVADYVLNVYFHDDDTLLVNLRRFRSDLEACRRCRRDRSGHRLSDGGYRSSDRARAGQRPLRDQTAHPGMGERGDAGSTADPRPPRQASSPR